MRSRTMLHHQITWDSVRNPQKSGRRNGNTKSSVLLGWWVSTPDKFPFVSSIRISFSALEEVAIPPPRAPIVCPSIHQAIPGHYGRDGGG